ncbi:MAG: alanine dehydrogenase [Flavipsychrobacter sp.]|nr:alanine dehydrogenase [Flavipsychrobacter sp.]
MVIGLIRERKTPPDERVPLTPRQCAYIMARYPGVTIVVEPSPTRCYTDDEYKTEGITLTEDLSACDVLLGVKEVKTEYLLPGKTYFFFSHTKKKQPYNQPLMHALIEKRIRMIDYECLTHTDEQRILGFGLYAGIVGAHNGLLTYGKKHRLYDLPAAHKMRSFQDLLLAYEKIKLPNIKIAVTGSGKVAAGVIDVMTNLDVEPVEPEDFFKNEFNYPVYAHFKGRALYARIGDGSFHRDDFHAHPQEYSCLFPQYLSKTDIIMNGIYWDKNIPRLFEKEDLRRSDFRVSVIADITCDVDGSVPINVGASTIADPVYGIDRKTLERVAPFQDTTDTVDVMAVDNLPNELPRDASQYFGVHFEKYVLGELLQGESDIIERATICKDGRLTSYFQYLSDYAY